MGKGRAACCDKSKVKRGSWSPEEDLKLISFIQKHGHHNWRSLPKQAGLVRCGKSCRLRWINYLRPDVKRGNFTEEEEQTIIKLHKALGNKWSKIASYLPGRTDNEIKNVWNTHLKKRIFLKCSSASDDQLSKQESSITSSSSSSSSSPKIPQVVVDGDDDQFNAQGPQFVTSMAENNTNEQNPENPPTSLYSIESTPISNNDTLEKEVVEIPFEADHDFWKLLDDDNIGGSFQSDGEVQQHQNLAHQDDERRKWFCELEKELGLEPETFDLETMKITNPSGSDPDIWPLA